VSDSNAPDLLARARREPIRLQRHLLVAAALREVLDPDPIVVGGTAEEYWTGAPYHPTDLDMCVPLSPANTAALRRLGFRRDGRHWIHPEIEVAVEFPEAFIDGDEGRTREIELGNGTARIIGVDDLYLDRLRQSTISDREGLEFKSALAVAAAAYEAIDWPYVDARLRGLLTDDPPLGTAMARHDRTIRRRARTV